jgi:quercetin dioxygenase-like cupin family protein
MDDRNDPKRNPIGTELVFEDDAVRVWRIDLEPGAEAPLHTHYLDYTTVVLEGDMVERPNADGSVDRIPVRPGQLMRWYDGPVKHSLRNVGTKTFRNVIVEIKNTDTGAE